MLNHRAPIGLVALSVSATALFGLTFGSTFAADREAATALMMDKLDEMGRYYAENPELTERKGSGWKPYNRYKWFHESRMEDDLLPEAGARWAAWEETMRRKSATLDRGIGSTWFSLGPTNFAGRMLDLAFDPNDTDIVYAGAAGGGLWKSTDGGDNWTPVTDELQSLAVGGVAVSQTNSDIVVIATGEGTFNIDRIHGVGILRSTDAGATWNTTDVNFNLSNGHGFHALEAGPNGTFLAGATDGLYRSDDDGATWTKVRTSGQFFDVKWKPGSPNTVYSVRGSSNSSSSNVKISTDDGLTWSLAGTGQPSGNLIGKSKLAVTPADPDYVYVIYVTRSGGNLLGVYRSTDGGATWNLRANSPNIPNGQGWYNLSLAVDPNDVDTVIAGGVQLFRSTDGGQTYGVVGGNVHVDHHVATYEPGSNSNVWVGSDGGLWRSATDGTVWTGRNNGLVTYQFYDICVNNGPTPYFVMGGTQDNGTDRWGGTTTWTEGLFADGMVCNINPVNGNTVYAEIQGGQHYKNLNQGTGSWTSIQSGITGSGAWVTPVDQDPQSGNHLYTSTSSGIFRTTQGGNPWVQVSGHTATWIDMSPLSSDVIWTTGSTTRITTDDGNSWTVAGSFGFSTGSPRKVHAHPLDVDAALVCFSTYSSGNARVALTTDRGATWSNRTGDLPALPTNGIVVDPEYPDEWYIATDLGVWKTTNQGTNWLPFGEDLPNTVVHDIEIQFAERKLVAGTHGRGAWEANLPSDATSVDVQAPVARNLMLDSPFPNPISDRTMLRFAARSEGAVSLAIYDVQGRLVNDVASFDRGDGVVRTTPWFVDDAPSGVYFAVLKSGAEQISRKLVVTR